MIDWIMSLPIWLWLLTSVLFGATVAVVASHKEIRAWWHEINGVNDDNHWTISRRNENDHS